MNSLKRRKEKMSKKERVMATFNNQETDRTPVYDLLLHDGAIEYFSGKFPPCDEEGVKLKCIATREMLDMTRGAGWGPSDKRYHNTGNGYITFPDIRTVVDRWISLGFTQRPFEDVESAICWLNEINKLMKIEKKNINLVKYRESFRENFIKIQNYIGDDTVQLHRESLTGLDYIRAPLGLELFSYMWVDEPGVIREHIELCTDMEVMIIHAIADKELSPCALTAGDIAFKHSTIHSPQWLRQEYFPKLKMLNDAWHEHDIKCLYHSDGNVMSVMDDLIASGIDGLNPIETNAGLDVGVLKAKYGDSIFLTGGIDMSVLLSYGTPEEVREVCRKALKDAPTGYFIGSTTELDNSSKLENILTMLDVAWNG